MKRATFTVLFFLRSNIRTKDGLLPIYVRVTANGKRAEFSLNKQIDKKEWNCIVSAKSELFTSQI